MERMLSVDRGLNAQGAIRQYYEEQYRRGRRGRKAESRRVRSNLRGMQIEPGSRIVDIGCGVGTTGYYLADQGAIAYGIDISFESVRTTAQSGHHGAALQANAECLPFADLSFDGATFLGTLEHFLDPVRALREARRVLQPGSQICLVVPNAGFFLFKLLRGTGQPHEVPRTREEWRELFETEGLEIEAVYRDIGPGAFSDGPLLRGVARTLVLFFSNLLPIDHAYQFVFICRCQPARSSGGVAVRRP
jgi:SAM-dependent methyltransferase